MNNIKLSVIVTTYNRTGLLKECMYSLVNQTVSNNLYEIIVVDNNLIDNTKTLFAILLTVKPA